MTDHPLADLEAFALGELDRPTAEAVMAHADACPGCASQLADLMRGVAALAVAEGDAPGAVRPMPERRPRQRWIVGSLAAAVLACAAWNVGLQMTAATVPVAALVDSHFTHHPLAGAGGHAKEIQALDGSWVYVVAAGLSPLRRYDVGIDGERIGSIRADLSGDATGYWTRPPSVITSAELRGPGVELRWNGH